MTSTIFMSSIATKFRWEVWQIEVVINNIADLFRNHDWLVVRVERDVEILQVEWFSIQLGFWDLVVIIILRGLIILVLFSFSILFLFMVLRNLNQTVTEMASPR